MKQRTKYILVGVLISLWVTAWGFEIVMDVVRLFRDTHRDPERSTVISLESPYDTHGWITCTVWSTSNRFRMRTEPVP